MVSVSEYQIDQFGRDFAGDPLLAGIRTGAWLDAQTFPPIRWSVPGVLPEGMALIVGPPKAGKSWLVLEVALAVAAGGKVLGKVDAGPARPVLYLALEDGDRRLQDRCRMLLGEEPLPDRFEYATKVVPGQAAATVAAWLEVTHHDAGPLVVVDTLGKARPPGTPGESAYAADYRIGGQFKEIADAHPGSTVLLVHHDRKAGAEDFVDSVSGTHGLAGAADTIIVLARPRGESSGLLKVTGRDVDESEYAITQGPNGCGWEIQGGDLEAAATFAQQARAVSGLGDRSADIVAYVNQHPDGVTPSDVEAALGVTRARDYLARAATAGRIVKAARGRYAPVASVACVAFNGDDSPNATDDTHATQTHLRVVEP